MISAVFRGFIFRALDILSETHEILSVNEKYCPDGTAAFSAGAPSREKKNLKTSPSILKEVFRFYLSSRSFPRLASSSFSCSN